jgi:putative peptidoglycan lipid II flippase
VRVVIALVVGALLMVQLEPVVLLGVAIPAGAFGSFDALGLPLGPLGLAFGASLGAWVEWWLLRRRLRALLGDVGGGVGVVARLFGAAAGAAVAAYGAGVLLSLPPLPLAAVAAAVFGCIYLALALAMRLPEARGISDTIWRRLRR